jgi:HD domain-containing protein/MASE9 protein
MRSLPATARAYVCVVVAAGLALCAAAVVRTSASWRDFLVLAVLFWVADSAYVDTRLKFFSVTTGFPLALSAVLLLDPWAAGALCMVGAVTYAKARPWFKRMFNGSQMAVSAFLSGLLYNALPGAAGVGFTDARFPDCLPAVLVAGVAFFVLNNFFVAYVIKLSAGVSLLSVWWGGVGELAFSSFGYGMIGLIMAVLWTGGVGPVAALLVLAPLLIARWAFQQYGEQHKAYEATVASLIRAVETKDYYTRGHSERVAEASVMLAEQLGMREDRLEMLHYAGMLHDVGKLGVPTKLLQKTGPLDDAEFDAIKLHPTRGVEMVNGIAFLHEAMLGIRHHHERVDGLGYPDGLAGEQIPEFARIIAVADAFDSMTSTRSYRSARSVAAAIEELKRWAGTQFDTRMVNALVAAVEAHGWDANVEPTEEVIDPSVLVIRDHDDPGGEIAAFGHTPYQRSPYYDDVQAQVS